MSGTINEKMRLLKFCKKEFNLDDLFHTYLVSKAEELRVEVRCIRLDGFSAAKNRAKRCTVEETWLTDGVNMNRCPFGEPSQ